MQSDTNLWFVGTFVLWVMSLVAQSALFILILRHFKAYKSHQPNADNLSMEDLVNERDALLLKLDQTKQELEEYRKDRLAFLANTPHELRTPLNAIIGLSELLQRPLVDDRRRLEFSRLIHLRSYDLLYAINNLIELSKIASGTLRLVKNSVNVTNLFDQIHNEYNNIYSLHSRSKNLIFRLEMSITVEHLLVDVVRLRHVLDCLLRNAILFTKEGTIIMGCKDQPGKQKMLFYLSDTGQGIPRDYRETIFQPFEKVPESISGVSDGAGLGLAVCRGIVDYWGGEIWVDSIVGRGSVFYFTLPFDG